MIDRLADLRRYWTPLLAGETSAADSPCPHGSVKRISEGYELRRDALGQHPMHVLRVGRTWHVASAVKDLMLVPEYRYEDVFTLPNGARLQLLDGGDVRPVEELPFYDYFPADFEKKKLGDVEYSAAWVRRRLDWVADQLLPKRGLATCLLSGGVDSMVAAYLFSRRSPSLTAYTMGLSSKVEDVALATQYAKAFKVEHRLTTVTSQDIVDAVPESIWRSEIYHLYNVYCAVGMVLLARELSGASIGTAFTGEGANEAFGDYHNWEVHKSDGTTVVIQSTDVEAFNSSRGRHAYVWGNPASQSKGFMNRQLGSGLAKHGVSRMHKPLYEYGVQLLSPFMDVGVLRVIAALPPKALAEVGGKPGFMALAMQRDIEAGAMPREFLANRKKTRLQDANPDGEGGITEVLLAKGYDQQRVLAIFNAQFKASIANDRRFTQTDLRS